MELLAFNFHDAPDSFFVVVHFQLQEKTSGFSSEGVGMVGPFPDAGIRFLLPMPSYRAGVGVDAVMTGACSVLSSRPSICRVTWIYTHFTCSSTGTW